MVSSVFRDLDNEHMVKIYSYEINLIQVNYSIMSFSEIIYVVLMLICNHNSI